MDEKEKATKREKLKKGKKGINVSLMHRFVMSGFDEIEDFNEFMKSAIKREQDLTSWRIKEGANRLDAEEREQYYEFFSEDYQKIGEVFEKLALDSFVVMLYARIETGMGTLCDALRQDRQEMGEKINLRHSDLSGSGYLDQAKLYIEKVLGVNLDLGNNAQWPEIVGLRILRNAIVHEEGWLSTKDAALKKHIKRGFIELEQREEERNGQVSGHLRVKSEYIDCILPQVRRFFQDIKI